MHINPQFSNVVNEQEPIGIVIADGGRIALPTRFSAFVWGPVPDADLESLPPIVLAREVAPALIAAV